MTTAVHETIAVLDFGSQYTQLIARRIREHGVFCRIHRHDVDAGRLALDPLRGVVLSGGPASAGRPGAPRLRPEILELDVPVLGICYGLQEMTRLLGGEVAPAPGGEYGPAEIEWIADDPIRRGLPDRMRVWMSHGDQVTRAAPGFSTLARSESCPHAALRHGERPWWGLQFHPEVTHTQSGGTLLANFLFEICGCRGDWTMENFLEEEVERIRDTVGERGRVVLGLSGGVDSSTAAALLHRAIGDRVDAIFVDHGLLRKGEREEVERTFRERFPVRLHVIDAADQFLADLAGVTDPEEKRRRIGHRFVRIFEEEARRCEGARFLAQGTLYPDVVESVSAHGGPSAKIKTHHNVGGLPEDLGLELIEPFRTLFKDEVRRLGRLLGVPRTILERHPFPGPGLAVRVLGEVTPERLQVLREADAIFQEELRRSGWLVRSQQAFSVLLPVRSVGVQGDARTYGNVLALRAVTTEDFMTADVAPIPHDVLRRIATRITNEVRAINRVVFDVTTKPPGTIEWE